MIRPAKRVKGPLRLPGDKSISHRAALIAALAQGDSHVVNFSTSLDCASTLSCLAQLGVSTERDGADVQIARTGNGRFSPPSGPLDCGNSGSTMRMLAGILAGQDFSSTLTGDGSLRARPMERIIEPLKMMGARVSSENGRPPLRIESSGSLSAIRHELPIPSAQVKTSLLFAGLQARGRTEVLEGTVLTRDHTERMLQWFGVPIEIANDSSGTRCSVVGPSRFRGTEVRVPGDFSAAAFFIAAATLLPGSEVEIENVGLNPTRTQFLQLMRSLGAEIETVGAHEDCNEPVGSLYVQGGKPLEFAGPRSSNNISRPWTAAMIDELPLIAVVGTQVRGGIVIRDAAELRTKESDRIAATIKNLRAMGADVTEFQDGLAVAGPARLQGAALDSHGDHRIAMAFSIAALLATGESEISGSECVAVSFPGFFECLESLVER